MNKPVSRRSCAQIYLRTATILAGGMLWCGLAVPALAQTGPAGQTHRWIDRRGPWPRLMLAP